MNNKILLFVILQSFVLSQAMDNEVQTIDSESGAIKFIEPSTGRLPIHFFPVKHDNITGNYSWRAYVTKNKTIYLPITRGYTPDSDKMLVDTDNLVFNLSDPEKPIFALSEQSDNSSPWCGDDFVRMNNKHTLYFTDENQVTDFKGYIQIVSANKRFVACLKHPRYGKQKINTLIRYNMLAQKEGEPIEHVEDFYTCGRTSVWSIWQPRNLKRKLVTWEDNETDENKVMLLNSGTTITLPKGIRNSWSVYSNRLSEDEKFLYIPVYLDEGVCIQICDIENDSWACFAKKFDGFWKLLPGNRYVLAYSENEPFYVWDLKTNKKVEISGMNKLNELAIDMGVDQTNPNWLYEFNCGTNKVVLGTRYYPDDESPDTSPIGFILDIAQKTVETFDEQNYLVNYIATTADDEYTFVRCLTSQEDDIKRYKFAKVSLDDTPIEWIEDVQINILRPFGFPEYDFSSYKLFTDLDGEEQLLQIPQNVFFNAQMKKYISVDIYEFVYIDSANRAIIVEKNATDTLFSEHQNKRIVSCKKSYDSHEQKPCVIVTYQDGKTTKLPADEYESVVDQMKHIRIQQSLLQAVDQEPDNSDDDQSKYHITVRDVDTDEILQEIDCDTYRYAECPDHSIGYIVTYKQGDENAKVWDITDISKTKEGYGCLIR